MLFNTTRIHSGPPSTRASIAMEGGVAFARVANTALISICGELQWSYELLRSLCASTRRDELITGTSIACSIAGKAVLARGRRYRVHVHM